MSLILGAIGTLTGGLSFLTQVAMRMQDNAESIAIEPMNQPLLDQCRLSHDDELFTVDVLQKFVIQNTGKIGISVKSLNPLVVGYHGRYLIPEFHDWNGKQLTMPIQLDGGKSTAVDVTYKIRLTKREFDLAYKDVGTQSIQIAVILSELSKNGIQPASLIYPDINEMPQGTKIGGIYLEVETVRGTRITKKIGI